MAEDGGDAGMVRAGAAFAARRRQKGISQRELARNQVIGAANLIAFEKGRSWPREKTRARLEQVVQWPPGELARLRADRPAADSGAMDASGPQSDAVAVVTEAVAVAAAQAMASTDQLPDVDDPAFEPRVASVLAGLRTLETLVTRAVRSTRGAPEVIRTLKTVRERYADLMALAASTPGATLGQRLYVARTAAALSPVEAADAIAVPADVVAAVEAEQFVAEEYRGPILSFISEMIGV